MKKYLSIIFLTFISIATYAQVSLREKQFNHENGLAIQGYDPVAYFTQNKAIKGDQKFAAKAEGVTYFFSSAVNKDLFIKDYKKYEPQYGGWCAYAMGATNEKVEIDPETFKILNGRLFLFYHSFVNNTLTKWNKNETVFKNNADKNWAILYK